MLALSTCSDENERRRSSAPRAKRPADGRDDERPARRRDVRDDDRRRTPDRPDHAQHRDGERHEHERRADRERQLEQEARPEQAFGERIALCDAFGDLEQYEQNELRRDQRGEEPAEVANGRRRRPRPPADLAERPPRANDDERLDRHRDERGPRVRQPGVVILVGVEQRVGDRVTADRAQQGAAYPEEPRGLRRHGVRMPAPVRAGQRTDMEGSWCSEPFSANAQEACEPLSTEAAWSGTYV